jgi:hypothetical protein
MALQERCAGKPIEVGAANMGISKNAFELLCRRAQKALDANNIPHACYRLGHLTARKKVEVTHRYKTAGNNPGNTKSAKPAQMAPARKGDTGRRNTVGTEHTYKTPEALKFVQS